MKMKWICLLILLLVNPAMAGCTKLHFKSADGMEATYNRYIMGQQITKLTVTPNADGSVTVTLEGMKSDAQAVTDVLNAAISKITVAP